MRQLKWSVTNLTRHEYNTNNIPNLLPPISNKKAWHRILNPPNTPLNNFLIGKRSMISHTILGAMETDNDYAYLNKLFSSIMKDIKEHKRI